MSEISNKLFMKKLILVLSLLPFFLLCCGVKSDERKAQTLFGEINQLLDQKEKIAKKSLSQQNLFSEENIKDFPNNRDELESTAKEQIRLFDEIQKLDEIQIDKFKQVENLNLEKNFLDYAVLLRNIQEKRIQGTQVGIDKFHLFLDRSISTRQGLEEKITQINQKQSTIDLEINQLEEQRQRVKLNE